ncbi:MAG: AmmeMemoRadiSam system radical SAM enzyme [bacterium]
MFEARYYEKAQGKQTRCLLCPHNCLIADNKTGICEVRTNKNGILYTQVYGEVSGYAVDPVEKKPLYHFYPGRTLFSIGTWGCNFKCAYCQNWNISQQQVETTHFKKEEIVAMALREGAVGIAYTYNEPTIWHEFVHDTAVYAKARGLKNVMVTNGFINEAPLADLFPVIDGMNIDLKAFTEKFYTETAKGNLAPVLKSIKTAYEAGVHIELTNLVVPGLNDSEREIMEMTEWIAALSPEIPLHFSRYFPQYLTTMGPTKLETLKKANEIASQKLKYVYIGNVAGEAVADTCCSACGKKLIKRDNYKILENNISGGKCKFCGEKIYGHF